MATQSAYVECFISSVSFDARGSLYLKHTLCSVHFSLQVSEEESDVDLSSIEELTAPTTAGRVSSDVGVTSGTSVWSSVASRAGAW